MKNKYGFPLVDCRRCGGSGSFGPASIHGGRCFDCSGTGVHVRRGKASQAWTAFLDAHRKFRTPVAEDVRVGDRVRLQRGDELLEVAAIEWVYLGGSRGESKVGTVGGEREWCWSTRLHVELRFTFTDGSTGVMGARYLLASRAGAVDPAPFLAML